MTRSVALLRGINVGPTTKVPMASLRTLFAEAGATDVTTLLNSGNVVFSGSVDAAALERRVADETGVSTRIVIVESARLIRIAAAMPFAGDDSHLVIAFMSRVPSVDIPSDLAPEQFALGADAAYQHCPLGISRSKLGSAFWKQFPPETTARNVRTVSKLIALL